MDFRCNLSVSFFNGELGSSCLVKGPLIGFQSTCGERYRYVTVTNYPRTQGYWDTAALAVLDRLRP